MNKLVKISAMGAVTLGLFGAARTASALSIRNLGPYSYQKMSVSEWGNGGGTGIWNVEPGQWESWNRTDSKGVLLVTHNSNKTYYLDSELSGYIQDDNVLRSRTGKTLTPIDTDQPSGTSGVITIKNNTSFYEKVAINKWQDNGSSRAFTIAPGATESWSRDDYRGYIMEVDDALDYYVKPGVNVELEPGGPKVNGQSLKEIRQQSE